MRRAQHRQPRLALLQLAVAGLAVLAGCGSSSKPGTATPSPGAPAGFSAASAAGGSARAGGVVQVVAGENFWGNITSQIGGAHVHVTSIITDPNADPHIYESDPKHAAAISSASFVVLNGVGYDDFAGKLLAVSPKAGRVVISLDKVLGVGGDNPNPHLWYDPAYVQGAARVIETQLAKADPADATVFAANLKTFLAAYQPYPATVAAIKAKYDAAPIAYTERVPGYLVAAAGLRLATPASFAQSIEDGNDPSAQDTAAIDAAMKDKTVKVLLYNGQVTSPTTQKVEDLAKSRGIPVVGVTETIPNNEKDFQTWQTDQAKAILAALGG